MVKVWNSPGPIVCSSSAVQVIVETASVMAPSPTVAGLASSSSASSAVQPSTGLTRTEAKGVPAGSSSSSLFVEAVSDSLGTEKVTCV